MYARLLYGWPSTPAYRPLTDEVMEIEPEFLSAITALVRIPAEDAEGKFAPQYISLSDAARETFEKFRQFVDHAKGSLDGRERQWFVKGEIQVLRLAGTLTYLDWAISLGTSVSDGIEQITNSLEPQAVDELHMAAAIHLWTEFFWPHARAALRQIGLTERHANARRVLRWIKAQGKNEVSREEIRREALGRSMDADQTQQLLDGLGKAGWLRPTTTDTTGRRRHRWQVNPIIHSPAESPESPGRVEALSIQ